MARVLVAVALLAASCSEDPSSTRASSSTGASSSTTGSGGSGDTSAGPTSSTSNGGGTSASTDAASSTGSVGGAGGSGGGAPAEPHSVELVLGVLGGGEDASDATVLVNAVDGALKMHFRGSELPVSVDLLDGDFVTLLSGVSQIQSSRVTPEVERFALGSAPFDLDCADGEMTVRIDVPEVPGATRYELLTMLEQPTVPPGPGLVEVTARACLGRAEATVLVVAYGGESVLAHETVSIPFQGGAEVDASVTLEDAPRETVSVGVESIAGARSLLAYAEWQMFGQSILEPEHLLERESPEGSSLLFEPDVIVPGFGFHRLKIAVAAAPIGRLCPRATLHRFGATPGPVQFDAAALRRAIEHEDGTWSWDGTGALGDTVNRVFRSGDDWWLLREHPEHPGWPAIVPELPGGDALPPFASQDIRHVDVDERDGYVEEVGSFARTSEVTTTRVLVTELCGS